MDSCQFQSEVTQSKILATRKDTVHMQYSSNLNKIMPIGLIMEGRVMHLKDGCSILMTPSGASCVETPQLYSLRSKVIPVH